jgi:hypothetical protein
MTQRTKSPDGRPAAAPAAEAAEATEVADRPRTTQFVGQRKDYRPAIPTIPTPAERFAAIRDAAERKRRKTKPQPPGKD